MELIDTVLILILTPFFDAFPPTQIPTSADAPNSAERELHKWTPDDLVGSEIMVWLEDEPGLDVGNGNWDQVAASEQLFGLKMDFDEINRS